jgi:hypothetical protein
MPAADQELLSAFDGHDAAKVRAALDAGANPCSPIRGKSPVDWLLEEYSRSDRLGDCLRLLLERGAVLHDTLLAPGTIERCGGVPGGREADAPPRCDGTCVDDGADSFLIQNGRIVAQTIHYTVRREADGRRSSH